MPEESKTLLPGQSVATDGKYLKSDGDKASWQDSDAGAMVSAHNTSETAHDDIRQAIPAAVSAHDGSETAHTDIRGQLSAVDAQLAEKALKTEVGTLANLLTTAKTSIVNAINELFNSKVDKAQEARISPTLLNGWTNLDNFSTRYMKDTIGVVWVEIYVTGTTPSSIIFTLPPGYRPDRAIYPIGQASSAVSGLMVEANGNVRHSFGNASSSYRYLFCFRAY